MSSPAPSGGSSPLRIGGFALVGLAVVAALVGLLTLATGGTNPDPNAVGATSAIAAPPPAEAPDPAPPTEPAVPPAPAPAPVVPAPTTAPAAVPGGPTDEAIAPLPPDATGLDTGSDVSAARAPVRVYNNSTIKGLAEQAADDFRGAGWDVNDVGNYPESQGRVGASTVYYTPGDGNEAAAESLGGQFGLKVAPRFAGLKAASDGLIVILARDYGN